MRLDPPLDPTSPEARDLLEDELRKGIYHEQRGLLERLWDWLTGLLDTTSSAGFPAWTVLIALAVGAAVVGLVLWRTQRMWAGLLVGMGAFWALRSLLG